MFFENSGDKNHLAANMPLAKHAVMVWHSRFANIPIILSLFYKTTFCHALF